MSGRIGKPQRVPNLHTKSTETSVASVTRHKFFIQMLSRKSCNTNGIHSRIFWWATIFLCASLGFKKNKES